MQGGLRCRRSFVLVRIFFICQGTCAENRLSFRLTALVKRTSAADGLRFAIESNTRRVQT